MKVTWVFMYSSAWFVVGTILDLYCLYK